MGKKRQLPETDQIVLGYLSCPLDGAGNFLGALLVTDHRTRPLQFAYVDPVRPTTIQKILYGDTLAEHVRIDVIGKKLLSDILSHSIHVLFVDSADLLNASRVISAPVAYVWREHVGSGASASLSTLRFDTGGNADDQDLVSTIIMRLEPSVDLMAPFQRLAGALKEIMKA